MVKLRLYQLIHEAIESPTYLNGFRRVGVEQARVEELLQKVATATAELSDDAQSSEKSQAVYDEIVNGYASAVANIEAAYGNAALTAIAASELEAAENQGLQEGQLENRALQGSSEESEVSWGQEASR